MLLFKLLKLRYIFFLKNGFWFWERIIFLSLGWMLGILFRFIWLLWILRRWCIMVWYVYCMSKGVMGFFFWFRMRRIGGVLILWKLKSWFFWVMWYCIFDVNFWVRGLDFWYLMRGFFLSDSRIVMRFLDVCWREFLFYVFGFLFYRWYRGWDMLRENRLGLMII